MPGMRTWKEGIRFALLIALIAMTTSPLMAQSKNPQPFETWLETVRQEARTKGISETVISTALADVKPVRRVIERDRNQSEFRLTLDRYMRRVVTPINIKRGRNKAAEHASLLDRIEKKYGVQRRFILAIWGIETRFGLVKANLPVIPAVATLAFDRRRSKYFRAQIFAVLEMLDKGYIELENLKGSWAGAMGQPQFMPTSYLAYAVDFDGDGRRDIWKDTGDVLGSIANYLAKHGWNNSLTWGRAVQVPASTRNTLGKPSRRAAPGCRAHTTDMAPLPDWQARGVRRVDGTALPSRQIDGALAFPDGQKGPAFLVYRNYRSIMAYNCAHLYAITVGVLSDKIGQGK